MPKEKAKRQRKDMERGRTLHSYWAASATAGDTHTLKREYEEGLKTKVKESTMSGDLSATKTSPTRRRIRRSPAKKKQRKNHRSRGNEVVEVFDFTDPYGDEGDAGLKTERTNGREDSEYVDLGEDSDIVYIPNKKRLKKSPARKSPARKNSARKQKQASSQKKENLKKVVKLNDLTEKPLHGALGSSSASSSSSSPAAKGKDESQQLAMMKEKASRQQQSKKKSTVLDTMPLLLPKKEEAMVLIQIDDEKLQLGAEVGAVGRLRANKKNGLSIDLKGQSYKAEHFRTSGSYAIVSYGIEDARIEAVSNSMVRLDYKCNIFELGKVRNGEWKQQQRGEDDLDYDVNEEWRKEEAERKKNKRKEKVASRKRGRK